MNRIETLAPETSECPVVTDVQEISERYKEYLGDESRMKAENVSAIYLPENSAQVAGALSSLSQSGKTCVISCGRTGITGAVAPIDADAVVSLSKMNRLLALGKDEKGYYVRVEPGMTLADLAAILDKKQVEDLPGATEAEKAAAAEFAAENASFWFPVDPTEMTAQVGGVVAANASGARTYRYGATRKWVKGLKMVFADGSAVNVTRGEVAAEGRKFVIVKDGTETEVNIPEFEMPNTKCTIGYFSADGMDLVDLFVGSEGTLGAFCEIELRLTQKPDSILGILAVIEDEDKALTLVENARACESMEFEAIEYFDHDALKLLKQKKDDDGPGSHIPEIPSWDGAAVYLEIGGTEEETEEACEGLEELLSSVGSSIDETWAAMEEDEHEQQKLFRHTVPEAVNTLIGQRAAKNPGLHKVGTDMAVPDEALREMFSVYRASLADAGLESVVFGHIGNNHVHVNILPKDLDELKKAKDLYLGWAKEAVRLRGAVAAEHGIGRIKKGMLEVQHPAEVLDAMREVRKAFDPTATLSPGVLV